MVTVYKIVRVVERPGQVIRVSLVAPGRAGVEYVPGMPSEPPAHLKQAGYGLLAYESIEAAVGDLARVGRVLLVELWEAEADSISRALPPQLNPIALGDGVMEEVPNGWPAGTVMVNRLTITRKVGYGRLTIFIPAGARLKGVGPNTGMGFWLTEEVAGPVFGYESLEEARGVEGTRYVLQGTGFGVLMPGPGEKEFTARTFEVTNIHVIGGAYEDYED